MDARNVYEIRSTALRGGDIFGKLMSNGFAVVANMRDDAAILSTKGPVAELQLQPRPAHCIRLRMQGKTDRTGNTSDMSRRCIPAPKTTDFIQLVHNEAMG